MGARHLVAPGNFPIGCMPIYLTMFQSSDASAFDSNNCVKGLNQFAQSHNSHLEKALEGLRNKYPDVVIKYAHLYNCLQDLVGIKVAEGSDERAHSACCGGGGGEYNFDVNRMCGAEGTTLCSDPSEYLQWDGVHLTQEAYHLIVNHLASQGVYSY